MFLEKSALEELNKIAVKMVASEKGLLAADESGGTIKTRFDAITVENTEKNCRYYREFMFRTASAMQNHFPTSPWRCGKL